MSHSTWFWTVCFRTSFPYGLPNCLQGRCVVWLTELIGDVLSVDNVVGAINHKDGSLQETPLFEPDTIILAKLLTAMCREGLVQHARRLLELRLHLGRVPTHGIDVGIGWQICAQGFPLSCHVLADRAPEAVHDAQQAHNAWCVSKCDRTDDQIHEIQVIQTEVGSGVASLQLPAHDRELLSACECFTNAFFHDGLLLMRTVGNEVSDCSLKKREGHPFHPKVYRHETWSPYIDTVPRSRLKSSDETFKYASPESWSTRRKRVV